MTLTNWQTRDQFSPSPTYVLQLITSFEWKLFPFRPCFQKASTLSCKQTVRTCHVTQRSAGTSSVIHCFSLCLSLPRVSMGKSKAISAASSFDGSPLRFTILTVSVNEHRKLRQCVMNQYDWWLDDFKHLLRCMTYFLPRWERCLCPAGLPVLPWVLHCLQTHRETETRV